MGVFPDVRMMGGVITLKEAKDNKGNAPTQTPPAGHEIRNGKVLGAFQVGIARSTMPVVENIMTITRGTSDEGHTEQTFGTKAYLDNATLRFNVRYCGAYGTRNGVTAADMAAYWTAVINGFEYRTSNMRGFQQVIHLGVLTFDNPEGAFDPDSPPRMTEVTNLDTFEEDNWNKFRR